MHDLALPAAVISLFVYTAAVQTCSLEKVSFEIYVNILVTRYSIGMNWQCRETQDSGPFCRDTSALVLPEIYSSGCLICTDSI